MNKNSSMSSFFNYFKDFISSKVPVHNDPLQQIPNDNKTNTQAKNDYSGNISQNEKPQSETDR